MMNILGFVSAILIIFSIISSFMLKQHVDDSEISKSMKGYYLADMKSISEYEEFLFDSQKKIKPPKEENKDQSPPPKDSQIIASDNQNANEEQKADKKEKKERKKTAKIYACSCLNIFPLIKNDKAQEKELYDLFTKLIKTLYQKELSKQKIENTIADALISSCKKKYEAKEEIQLEKIDLKDPALQTLWYKMLKGTKGYDFEKNIGLPSILSFIYLEDNAKENKICIPTSSKEMLTALFDNKIAEKIWEKRKNQRTKISKEELETILKENPSFTDTNIWNYISVSHKSHNKNARITICKDDSTGVSIQRICRYQ